MAEVQIRGLAELQRAFRELPPDYRKNLREELQRAVMPVQARAESLAQAKISHIGPRWSQMRIGVTPGVVYVAPRQRGRRGPRSRPNLAPLLMDKAMFPALEQSEREIVKRVEQMIDNVSDFHGF